ncbi:hypothetical protein A6J42_21065 [Leptospira interrogans serovar Copenhageni]|uniref:Uncharacterized protein n=2 Tax=Leptospira interrogans TaxID=173 RepID=A0AAP9W977_LEPIR|nr:hypothetical protein A6J42_21065 [Leptospira interrogans serovar Copenhageni]MBE0303745.1 hypothetical protein [Leptospira interrogans serovar Yeoncheon]QCO34535.1 hypothetical protein E4414_16845 [Leptospira interrogans]QEH98655.1 hypothetical protein FWJ33_03740 [Leptospira interrogans serovar Hardjo]QOI37246.1 hypothetical protein Lepto1548_02330 [Leptospira interrogans serovar Bataviae]QOI41204.1 hypothetical protein Lepto782_02070 [Leptospira interrogans serovar Canicola]QOI45632.1 hy
MNFVCESDYYIATITNSIEFKKLSKTLFTKAFQVRTIRYKICELLRLPKMRSVEREPENSANASLRISVQRIVVIEFFYSPRFFTANSR